MLDSTAPIPLDYRLPGDAYYHLVRTLRVTLPPPLADTAEALLQRDHAAIARIAALAPGNSAEADFAAQYVAASEQWKDCLRLLQQPATTPECAAKYRAQAGSMMRQANSAMRLLLQMQAARRKLEADNVLCDRAERAEHDATQVMAEALDTIRAEPARPPAAAPAPAARDLIRGLAGRAAPPVLERPPAATAPAAEPEPELVAEAEQYAAIYPDRARLIRAMGRVPDDATFGPPDDDLVLALVTARTPALAALDRPPPPCQAP